jgi:hypothetical protein
MKKVSIFKKIKLFNQYKGTVSKNLFELQQKFNIRVDAAKRMYTVLNIPPDFIGEAYSLKKTDIDTISENFIKDYSSEVSKYLNTKGLSELFDFYEIKKVDKYSYLLVFGFSLFRSDKYYNTIYYVIIPTISILLLFMTLIFI